MEGDPSQGRGPKGVHSPVTMKQRQPWGWLHVQTPLPVKELGGLAGQGRGDCSDLENSCNHKELSSYTSSWTLGGLAYRVLQGRETVPLVPPPESFSVQLIPSSDVSGQASLVVRKVMLSVSLLGLRQTLRV